jgi:hypothetical protein
MLIWTMFDCRYKLDQVRASWCELEGAKEKNIGAGHIQATTLGHPGAWIMVQEPISPSFDLISVETLEFQIMKNSVDWIVIQVTRLIN